ncbi:hypothetical protein ETC03_28665, partial [Geobacillus sp. MMMUD3]|nr:hypothetical protein [Geobacillus sp. MMMUD3]
DQRTGGIFTAVLDRAQQELGDAERRTSTGLSIGMLTRQNSTEEEVEFLSRFIGTIEPGIAAWTKEQADPESWALDRDSLVRLGKQLAVRYDTRDEMMADDEVAFVAGAMRFIGETIRRIGLGQWRYGADLEADD